MSKEVFDNLQELKSLKSHLNPHMTITELIGILAKEALNAHPSRRKASSPEKSLKVEKIETEKLKIQMGVPRSRYIPVSVKHKVWIRDQGKCTFVNTQTGEVCESKHLLQYDHIHEFSKGGSSLDPNNLRLLCGAHNRFRNRGSLLIP